MSWQLAQCASTETRELNRYLAENWEPFAITEDGPTIWLRRQVQPRSPGRGLRVR